MRKAAQDGAGAVDGARPGIGILVVAVLGAVLGWLALDMLEQPYRQRAAVEAHLDIQQAAAAPRARLERELASVLDLATGLVTVFSIDGLPDDARFDALASHLLRNTDHIRNITLSEGTVMRWVWPRAGNTAVIGVDYRSLPDQWPLVEQAMTSGNPVIAGPLTLVQGGTAVIQRMAVTADDAEGQRALGVLSLIIDMDSVVAAAGLADPDQPIELALRGQDPGGEPFLWGSKAIFDADPVVLDVRLPGRTWHLAAVPRSGWHASAGLQPFLSGLKIGAAGLIALGLYLFQAHLHARRAAVAGLAASAARLSDAQRIGGLGAFEWEPAGDGAWWSEEFRELFGWPTGTPMSASRILESIHPDDRPGLRAALEEVVAGASRLDHECRITRPDGGTRTVRFWAGVVPGGQGLRGLVRDVTEQAQADAERERLVARLTRSNEELEQFATIASHDLQEPLRQIASHLQLLQRRFGGHLDADAHTFIGFAVEGAKRMQRQVLDLLDYARLNTASVTHGPVDTNAVLSAVITELAADIEAAGARIHAAPLPPVHGDAAQLAMLFHHLLANGLQHGYPGQAPDIDIRARDAGPHLEIMVGDQGVGIAPEFHDQVFGIFKRLGPPQGESSGIGLAICRRITETHGGRIWMDSQPGAGTTVHLTLPAARMPAPAPA